MLPQNTAAELVYLTLIGDAKPLLFKAEVESADAGKKRRDSKPLVGFTYSQLAVMNLWIRILGRIRKQTDSPDIVFCKHPPSVPIAGNFSNLPR
jgi:hypothetical protein